MKILVTILGVMLITSCSMQPTEAELANSYKSDEAVIVNKKDKKTNYLASREHVAMAFNDASSVIKMDDKEAGLIIVKGLLPCDLAPTYVKLAGNYTSHVAFSLKIVSNDSKIESKFTEIREQRWQGPSQYSSGGTQNLPIADKESKELAKKCVEDFKTAMATSLE